MSTRKRLGRSLALRPTAESLEGRQLLSGTVTGMNTAGDQWTLTLKGKGSIQVIKQNDPTTGVAGTLTSKTEIKTIILSGTDPFNSVLTDTVKPATGSTGQVYFQNLIEQSNKSERLGIGLGPQAINIPDFYLAQTSTTSTASTSQPVGTISIPDGVNTLRFGGVDATKFFGTDPTQGPTGDGQNDQFLIRLGLPAQLGTSIVVNSITSGAQAAAASTGTTANSPTQKSVVFNVSGRLNLFEANSIVGNSTLPNTANSFNGGTIVAAVNDPASGISGEVGFVRVGGNATNFSAVSQDKIANYYVGGETQNNAILAPGGTRRLYFGKGADTINIYTRTIESLQANRGITNSAIISERQIGDLVSGGNVSNSLIASGYNENFTSLVNQISNAQLTNGQFFSTALTFPTPTAQAAGFITTFISGNISNSVFVASVNPTGQPTALSNTSFGNPQDVFLPLGQITAKLQGGISNATAVPGSPNLAFFAQKVHATNGVVVPPNVPEPPLPLPATPVSLVGVPNVFPNINGTGKKTTTTGTGTTTGSGGTTGTGSSTGTGTPSNGSGPGIGTGTGTGTNTGTGTGTSTGSGATGAGSGSGTGTGSTGSTGTTT